MNTKLKKFFVALLFMALIFPTVNTSVIVEAATNDIIIHYHRDDAEYDKWNIWAWGEGADGAAYQFDADDAFGKVANITLPAAVDSVGFIVRTDSWEKDTGDDRFIDISLGSEIWVMSGQSEFTYEAPPGYESSIQVDKVNLSIEYTRYDEDYSGVTLDYVYAEAASISYNNGFSVAIDVVEGLNDLTFTINKDGQPDDYSAGKIALGRVEENGNLEVSLMQGTDIVSYKKGSFSQTKGFSKAEIVESNKISVTLSAPAKAEGDVENFVLKDEGGNSIAIAAVEAVAASKAFPSVKAGFSTDFVIETQESLDFASKYKLEKRNYGSTDVVLGNVFGTESFAELFTYTGDDLGAIYTKDSTSFRVWTPTSSNVNLLIYSQGNAAEGDAPIETIPMQKDVNGTWVATVQGDYAGKYYVYENEINGVKSEATDPYAKAVGVNGMRGMVVDLTTTDPEGFREQSSPAFANPTDAIIYEIHVRDLSMSDNSGIDNAGKFLGFTETGTTNDEGLSTGIDHIKELGATHVHLLPSFDFKTIDETDLESNTFNWGYDPQNYNVPEGSYSTDPYNGDVRIKEFKQMVQAMHQEGLRVVMDVVYNHTYTASDSNLNLLVPNYYHRTGANGAFTNGSGCGNETASERSMVRKLIVDSVVFWAKEYKVDGFRFDLMALHDIETMNQVRAALNEIDPSIIVYGEGWEAGGSPLDTVLQSLKANSPSLDNHIAAFSDDIRDGIKGSVFNANEPGFINGAQNRSEDVKFGIVASTQHDQIDLSRVSYSDNFWAKNPTQTVNYASAHDNLSLWDKLKETNKTANNDKLIAMNKMSAAIVLTSQGIPFFQAGEEFGRTKKGNENSYNAPDSINKIDWSLKSTNNDLYNYYKGLIELRKTYDSFRLTTTEQVQSNLRFVDSENQFISYTLENVQGGDYARFAVAFNSGKEDMTLTLSNKVWDVLVDGEKAGIQALASVDSGSVVVPAGTSIVLAETSKDAAPQEEEPVETTQAETTAPTTTEAPTTEAAQQDEDEPKNNSVIITIAITFAAICVIVGGYFVWSRKRKR